MTSNTRSNISVPPGLAVRMIRPGDDDPIRAVFAAAQEEVFLSNSASDELRRGVREWVDRVMAADMAQPSRYYSAPRKGFWVAEAEDGGIAATVAIDTTQDPDVAELFRMVVSPSHRRKGLGRVMVQTAEQWTREQGYRKLVLTTTEMHVKAVPLYESMGFVRFHTEDMGFLKAFEFEKLLAV